MCGNKKQQHKNISLLYEQQYGRFGVYAEDLTVLTNWASPLSKE